VSAGGDANWLKVGARDLLPWRFSQLLRCWNRRDERL